MTDAEKDAAWQSLPEEAKEKARKEFRRHKGCNSSTGNDYCCGYIGALKDFFGTHNLTTTEEKKPLKVGDIVRVSQGMDWGSETFKDAKKCFCNTPSEIVDIKTERATIKAFVNGVSAIIPLKELIPYTGQELKASAAEGLIQMTKDEMGIVNNDTPHTGTPDWLAYRMESAKEVVKVVYHHKNPHKDIIDDTITIVDGIVERLKGGDSK